jgi:MFS family permease
MIMFLMFLSFGTFFPILSLYLTKYLHFTGTQTGIIMSMSAVSAIVAPLIGSFVADRLISAEKLFAICNFGGAVIVFYLSRVNTFVPFLIGYLTYMIFTGPLIPLSNTIIFHHIRNREQEYGKIRIWGTFGWISAALLFGWVWLRMYEGAPMDTKLASAFVLSALSALGCGIISLGIPDSKFDKKQEINLFPVKAFKTFLKPEVILISICGLLVFSADRFYFFGSGPFMKELGFQDANILPSLSIGQLSEIFAMLTLGWFLVKYKLKNMLIIGAAINLIRYLIFSIAGSQLQLLSGVVLHGMAYTFFYSVAYIYLDKHTNRDERAGVHQIYRILTAGLGNVIGNYSTGKAADLLGVLKNAPENYQWFWLIPALLVGIAIIALLFLKIAENDQPAPAPDST